MPPDLDTQIKTLLKEGCGIRSIGRILNSSATTIIRRIEITASKIKTPEIYTRHTFEVDELCTFISNKKTPVWIAYAITGIQGR